MKKLGLPIILILMMLITPIASAFEHCAGMDMSGHLSESQHLSVNLSAKNSISLDHKKMLKGVQNNGADMDCHTRASCKVHVCGGYGITSSVPTIKTVTSSYFPVLEYTSPYNTVLSSDLRPPIVIL